MCLTLHASLLSLFMYVRQQDLQIKELLFKGMQISSCFQSVFYNRFHSCETELECKDKDESSTYGKLHLRKCMNIQYIL